MRTRRNGQQNTPHSEAPSGIDRLLKRLQAINKGRQDDGERIRKTVLDEEARTIVRGYKESGVEEALRSFRIKKYREETARLTREVHDRLKCLAPLFMDEPENPTICLQKYGKDRRLNDEIRIIIDLHKI